MNTPTGRHDDGPIDASVRHLLWRLRARLVTPPPEQRVQDDLDRLFAAAQEQAHVAPSAGASSLPTVDGRASAPDHPASVSGPAEPVVWTASEPITDLRTAREGRRRGLGPTRTVGRVAAALVVLAVATGVAGARDGVETLRAFLSPDGPADTGEPVPQVDDLALPDEAARVPEGGESSPGHGGGEADLEAPSSDSGGSVTGTEGEDASIDDARDETGADAGDGTADDGATGDGSQGPSPNTGSSSEGSGTEGAEVDEAAPEEPTDGVVAAPDPDDGLAGFGGPRSCDEEKLERCLPEEDGEDAPEAGDAADGDDGESAEDLAARRYKGEDQDAEDAGKG